MKNLSTHIQESLVNESSKLENIIQQFLVAQRMPTSGSKIRAVQDAEAKIETEIKKIDTTELIKIHTSASNGSVLQLHSAKELTSRAYEKLQDEANKNRQGTIGSIQTIKHAIEILEA